jgi:glycosyltransferase involved in cell wall biosynthesis
MRIALVSTSAISTPPAAYGGTERVVAELSLGLRELGHDVTVYATGDSSPAGTLRWIHPRAVWPRTDESERRHARFAVTDLRARGGVDVVHFNHASALEFCREVDAPCVLTLHDARDEGVTALLREHPEVAVVAISRRQAELLPELEIARVIHHGVDIDRYPFGAGDGGYVAFVGRFTADKAPHLAIDAAVAAGVPIRLAGQPQEETRPYFNNEVVPRLAQHRGRIDWPGELTELPKIELLRGARALLFPIEWEEPFGLVMIEAMLVGTPVIAFARGSVREVVDPGVTGILVRNSDEMASAIRAVDGIDRARCRARARERFSYVRMARDYVDLYERLARRRTSFARPSLASAPPR